MKKELIEVLQGDVWREKDERAGVRFVDVVEVVPGERPYVRAKGYRIIEGGRKVYSGVTSTIQLHTLRAKFRLVSRAPAPLPPMPEQQDAIAQSQG